MSQDFNIGSAVIYEHRIFLVEHGARVRIATYFTTDPPPAAGALLDITMFREEEAYPEQVKVLSLEEAASDEPSIVNQAKIFYVTVERA